MSSQVQILFTFLLSLLLFSQVNAAMLYYRGHCPNDGRDYLYVKEFDSYCIINNLILKSRTTKDTCEQKLEYTCDIAGLEYCGNLNEDKFIYKNSVCTLTRGGKDYQVPNVNSQNECIGFLINGHCTATDYYANLQKNCKGTPQFFEEMGFCTTKDNCRDDEISQDIVVNGRNYKVCDKIYNDTENNLMNATEPEEGNYSIEVICSITIKGNQKRNLNKLTLKALSEKIKIITKTNDKIYVAILKKTDAINTDNFEIYDYDSGYRIYAEECENNTNYYCINLYKTQINLLIKFVNVKKFDSVFQGIDTITDAVIKELNKIGTGEKYSYNHIFSDCSNLVSIKFTPVNDYSEAELNSIKNSFVSKIGGNEPASSISSTSSSGMLLTSLLLVLYILLF